MKTMSDAWKLFRIRNFHEEGWGATILGWGGVATFLCRILRCFCTDLGGNVLVSVRTSLPPTVNFSRVRNSHSYAHYSILLQGTVHLRRNGRCRARHLHSCEYPRSNFSFTKLHAKSTITKITRSCDPYVNTRRWKNRDALSTKHVKLPSILSTSHHHHHRIGNNFF